MSGKKQKSEQPNAEFIAWHAENCPRLKQGRDEVCDGLSVWWMDRKNMTCFETWEMAEGTTPLRAV